MGVLFIANLASSINSYLKDLARTGFIEFDDAGFFRPLYPTIHDFIHAQSMTEEKKAEIIESHQIKVEEANRETRENLKARAHFRAQIEIQISIKHHVAITCENCFISRPPNEKYINCKYCGSNKYGLTSLSEEYLDIAEKKYQTSITTRMSLLAVDKV